MNIAARRRVSSAVLAAALVAGLAACAAGGESPRVGGLAAHHGEARTAPDSADHGPSSDLEHFLDRESTCDDGAPATASYAPADVDPLAIPDGSTMARIRERGALRVGISADTLRMSARNPFTGDIEGFDIDVARAIAKAVLGDPDKVRFRVITSAQREQVLVDHQVDVVVRTFSITCERWDHVAFSAEYYHAGQKLLVPMSSGVQDVADLDGQRVCAPAETTSLALAHTWKDVTAVPAATHTQCLALFQRGKVDAITGDDTVLAGFAAQDPYARVVGKALSDEPYGVGIPADQVDMVRFVNAVLAERADDGSWLASHDRWLSDVLGAPAGPPEPVYGRTT